MSEEDFDEATLAEAQKRADEFEFGGDVIIDKYHRAIAYACFLEGVKYERQKKAEKIYASNT